MKCHIPKLNAGQMNTVKEECRKQFRALVDDFNRQAALQLFYILHTEYGFGQQRLEGFAEKLKAIQEDLKERYELPTDDTPWLCETKLREDHIDVDKLLEG